MKNLEVGKCYHIEISGWNLKEFLVLDKSTENLHSDGQIRYYCVFPHETKSNSDANIYIWSGEIVSYRELVGEDLCRFKASLQ